MGPLIAIMIMVLTPGIAIDHECSKEEPRIECVKNPVHEVKED